ncbi:lytic polysaccharide monooxygenase [Streptomyces sp. HNM0574]|uniref:lytic polysaccharide monooxygenase auxiliary activity family 9 protein n=1 Tax=Streptomyces sp. HNM0574 TaxID=2714954 RepID=UPI00146D1720|nr:lytic polysaccharide monooxygenase [Streptomyces sp. HNM0574]NLU69044.1 lytic polysaccharide monooxygenase [Streptomyces sp. HNM0574]
MTVRRKAAGIAALGIAPLALTLQTAGPAAAHGSMEDPVSRVSTCFAEGPESPKSAACKAAVEASGAQAFYDWNEVNIPDAAGKHKEIIPDGKLCSAGRDKYRGLDLPRADWPATKMKAGSQQFSYKATAPHKGSFELYLTKDGYDPSKPLKWSDLESKPFATVKDPQLKNGSYVIDADVPQKSGRHLVYSVWQRSDSPEAFYTCSDVTFGGGAAGATAGSEDAAPGQASAPEAQPLDDRQIEAGAGRSSVDHSGHGADHQGHNGTEYTDEGARPAGGAEPAHAGHQAASGTELAETGGDDGTTALAAGGAAVLAAGAAVVFTASRRRTRNRG